ncbi:MAG: tetratricopeptide repeat protein [Myxococcota bacterium]
MSKRLAMLEQLTGSGKADSFTWYALALEYKSAGRVDDALTTFSSLRERDPGYVPMYLMAGSMLIDAGREEEARKWLEDGMQRATEKGDSHACDEMQTLLESTII